VIYRLIAGVGREAGLMRTLPAGVALLGNGWVAAGLTFGGAPTLAGFGVLTPPGLGRLAALIPTYNMVNKEQLI